MAGYSEPPDLLPKRLSISFITGGSNSRVFYRTYQKYLIIEMKKNEMKWEKEGTDCTFPPSNSSTLTFGLEGQLLALI